MYDPTEKRQSRSYFWIPFADPKKKETILYVSTDDVRQTCQKEAILKVWKL